MDSSGIAAACPIHGGVAYSEQCGASIWPHSRRQYRLTINGTGLDMGTSTRMKQGDLLFGLGHHTHVPPTARI